MTLGVVVCRDCGGAGAGGRGRRDTTLGRKIGKASSPRPPETCWNWTDSGSFARSSPCSYFKSLRSSNNSGPKWSFLLEEKFEMDY